ncbi:MAG: hydrogenase 4 subunit B [Alphaproteobacteria bacterium]|nr:hydrogenase 4 subunit B [Alphaproteobacteria bacterium]
MTNSVSVLLLLVAAQLATAVIAVVFSRSASVGRLVYGLSFFISSLAVVLLLFHLLALGEVSRTSLPLGLPWIGANFRLDALSSLFLLIVDFGGAIASLYALGYGRHEDAPHRVLPFYAAFLAGMNLVVLADDAFTFLLSWELMSLTSWALVVAHHRSEANRKAGVIYLVMASFGTFCLLLAFGLLAGSAGAYGFDAIRALPPGPGIAGLVLILALVGAGSKAGLVPLHVWLPLAHPAAPSHVSALMSGVMTKVAIYGFIRIVFDLLGPPAWWWSLVVLALAGITSVMGVLYALMQHDIKRLLAYHTVENVGIIFIGLGLALAFRAYGMVGAGALALTAGLLHAVNHSVFKSLLFFGSGAILTATGERDMEQMGGLIHRMPHTAFAFLVGSAAISALPPLNGFVSEWLTFQAILLSPQLPSWGLKFLVPATGALLALSAALAAACFVKAFGIIFLGRPRSDAATKAREVDRFSLAAMYALVAFCLIIGILPGPFIDLLAPVVKSLMLGQSMPHQSGVAWMSIVPIAESRSSYNGLLVFLFIAVSAWLAALAIHRFASRATRRGPAWDCGAPDPRPITQYSASSFAQPIRRVFGSLVFRARENVVMPPPGDLGPARLDVALIDPVWDGIYKPVSAGILGLADRLNRLQFLTIRQFLMLVFSTLVLLLLVLAIWQ